MVCREAWSATVFVVRREDPDAPDIRTEQWSALMGTVESFGLVILLAALAGVAAVLSSRVSERLRVPAPAFFLIGAAVASDLVAAVGRAVVRDRPAGGHGRARCDLVRRRHAHRVAAVPHRGRRDGAGSAWPAPWSPPVRSPLAAHLLFAFDWRIALLLGTALAPTDPAVVFSVLGRREIAGRSGVAAGRRVRRERPGRHRADGRRARGRPAPAMSAVGRRGVGVRPADGDRRGRRHRRRTGCC